MILFEQRFLNDYFFAFSLEFLEPILIWDVDI